MSSEPSFSALSTVDAWIQPLHRKLFDMVPEAYELLRKSGSGHWVDKMINDPDFCVSVEDTVKMMDEAGIRRACISAWYSPKGAIVSNEVVAEYVEKYPDRFIGCASVDIRNPVQACKTLEYYVKEKGFKGLRMIPWLWEVPPTTNLFYPLFAKCVELGIPFMTQVGHTGPLYPSEPGRPVPYIDRIALDFPDLTIICGHIGYPWTDEMIGVAWKHKNVYIDTSAYLPNYYPPQLITFMKSYGKHKVLFGSNFPMLSFKKCHEQAKKLPLSPSTMKLFLHGNAERILNLDNAKSQPHSSKL